MKRYDAVNTYGDAMYAPSPDGEMVFYSDVAQWVSVDFVKLNLDLIVPAARHEGPDYYKGYHQAREDMLSTLPPSEDG